MDDRTLHMDAFVKVMKALSEPNRVEIIKILQHGDKCVWEIQAVLGLAQPSVSKHLKILAEAELVNSERDGRWVNYYLAKNKRNPYASAILGNLRHWLEGDVEIKRFAEGN